MAIKKIRMRPEGTGDYGDILHPETSADLVIETDTKKVMTSDERTKLSNLPTSALPTTGGDLTGTLKIMELKEHCSILTSAYSASEVIQILDGALYYNKAAATNDVAIGVRGDGSTLLNTVMAIGESMTFAVLLTNSTTAYKISSVVVSSGTTSVFWANGSAPTGNANSVDAYLFHVIKIADNVFAIFASQSKFATVA
jgi:hypothetical protein